MDFWEVKAAWLLGIRVRYASARGASLNGAVPWTQVCGAGPWRPRGHGRCLSVVEAGCVPGSTAALPRRCSTCVVEHRREGWFGRSVDVCAGRPSAGVVSLAGCAAVQTGLDLVGALVGRGEQQLVAELVTEVRVERG